jgi:CheY-like chemotaxis protein
MDDRKVGMSLSFMLETRGYPEVRAVRSPARAESVFGSFQPAWCSSTSTCRIPAACSSPKTMKRIARLRKFRLIALTNDVEHAMREEARVAGFERYLVKPVTQEAVTSFSPSVRRELRCEVSLLAWSIAVFVVGAQAQTITPLPANAVASRYGEGWQCQRGHERVDKVCNPIQVPEHAFLNFSGESWQCQRNFVRKGQACVPVRVPPAPMRTTLPTVTAGAGDRGYQERDGACMKVAVPSNAYLVSSVYGRGWECGRGFRRQDMKCGSPSKSPRMPTCAIRGTAGTVSAATRPSRSAARRWRSRPMVT